MTARIVRALHPLIACLLAIGTSACSEKPAVEAELEIPWPVGVWVIDGPEFWKNTREMNRIKNPETEGERAFNESLAQPPEGYLERLETTRYVLTEVGGVNERSMTGEERTGHWRLDADDSVILQMFGKGITGQRLRPTKPHRVEMILPDQEFRVPLRRADA